MSNPDPGWYPDPERPGLARYFDGAAWTEHLRPIDGPGAGTQPAAPDPATSLDSAPHRRRWRKVLVGLIGVALLAAVGGAAALLLQRSDRDVTTVASTAAVTTAPTRTDSTDRTTNTEQGNGGTTEKGDGGTTEKGDGGTTEKGDGGTTKSTSRPGSGASIAPVALSELEPVDQEADGPGTSVVEVNGTTYTDSVYFSGSSYRPSWVEYDLGRKFGRMTGVVGFNQDADAEIAGTVQVFGDGVELFSGPIRLTEIAQLDVPVDNVLRLRLQITYTGKDRNGSIVADGSVVFADTELVP